MCGRFTLGSTGEELGEEFGLDERPDFDPRYNVAPSQPVAVITNQAPRRVALLRWGLVPFWAKDPTIGHRMINARAETVADRPSFKHAFRRRRCLVLADGYYEWQRTAAGKQPMYIQLASGRPFGMAGLWETWKTPDGENVRTCTIITTEAAGVVAPIHDRMPVIIAPADRAAWLASPPLEPAVLTPLLGRTPVTELSARPVSTLVNSPANDVRECIEPVPG